MPATAAELIYPLTGRGCRSATITGIRRRPRRCRLPTGTGHHSIAAAPAENSPVDGIMNDIFAFTPVLKLRPNVPMRSIAERERAAIQAVVR